MRLHDGITPHGAIIHAFGDGCRALVAFILEFLDTAIPNEGTDDNHVRDSCGGKDFERCDQGAILLRAGVFDYRRNPVTSDGDQDQGETK
jgi:hypothetical protein